MTHDSRTVRRLRSRRWRRHRISDAERRTHGGDDRRHSTAHQNTPHPLFSAPPAETPAQFWWRHARWPLKVFPAAALLFASTHIDLALSSTLFFDASSHQWLGAGNWWINDVVHTGGRWAVRIVVALALAAWIATLFRPSVRKLRRPLSYFVIAVVLTIGVVGLLKAVTNIDCPWDLQAFGDRFRTFNCSRPGLSGCGTHSVFRRRTPARAMRSWRSTSSPASEAASSRFSDSAPACFSASYSASPSKRAAPISPHTTSGVRFSPGSSR